MSHHKKYFNLVFFSVLGIALFAQTGIAHAWGSWQHHRHDRGYHRSYPYGRVTVGLPGGFFTLSVGGSKYYYHGGCFYRPDPYGYVIVPAPIGAMVTQIPVDREIVYINGIKYEVYDGVYYVQRPDGYEVVTQPVAQPVTVPVAAAAQPAPQQPQPQESFTVNVPNIHGGYTAVIISRKGIGFTGPQGEYYDQFPKVEQLKVMYGS